MALAVSVAPEPVEKGLFALSWPLLVSVGLSLSLGFVDALFLSRVSDDAAGGVGAVLPVLGAVMVSFTTVAQAGASVLSQLLGAGRRALVPTTRAAIIYFNTAFGMAVLLGLWFGNEALARWMGLPPQMAVHAQAYVQVIGATHLLKSVQAAYAGVLNSRGQTGWVLAEAVVTTLSNLGINAWFHIAQWGESGAARVAYATSLAQAVGLVLTLYVVHRHLRIEVRWRAPVAELRARLAPVLRIGLPSMLEPVAYQAAQTSIMMMLVGMGARTLATRVYVLNFFTMTTVLWCVGLGMGAQILVAHRVGARRFDDAHRVLRHALAVGATGCFALAVLVWAGHEYLLRLFTDDPQIFRMAGPIFLLGIGVETGRAFNVIAGGALRSTGDARFTALVGGSMMWLVGVTSAWLLGVRLGWGLTGVWLAMAVDELSRAGVNLLRWNSGAWRSKGVAH